jgi:hypothetical protein
MQFPSDSGILPVNKNDLEKLEAKVYTDYTLAFELVDEAEIKPLKFDTIPE